jgi:hypothetical protein
VHALVVKKLKSADGTPTTMATAGIADDDIRKDDTIIVPSRNSHSRRSSPGTSLAVM